MRSLNVFITFYFIHVLQLFDQINVETDLPNRACWRLYASVNWDRVITTLSFEIAICDILCVLISYRKYISIEYFASLIKNLSL